MTHRQMRLQHQHISIKKRYVWVENNNLIEGPRSSFLEIIQL